MSKTSKAIEKAERKIEKAQGMFVRGVEMLSEAWKDLAEAKALDVPPIGGKVPDKSLDVPPGGGRKKAAK